jgi:protein-L-isoaspartate(D-aspartate) O-methyltransferase
MPDFAIQRRNMVESQVRPSSVTDRRIMTAMTDIARETFVPARFRDIAYMDTEIEFAPGRTMMAPRDLARLIQQADVAASDRVLVVGSALGYTAAVLARMAREVVALESVEACAAAAEQALKASGTATVTVQRGPLNDGAPDAAPFDVIFVEGILEADPQTLIGQLADGGRLVAVVVERGVQRALRIEKGEHAVARSVLFECAASRLPDFAPVKPAFSF